MTQLQLDGVIWVFGSKCVPLACVQNVIGWCAVGADVGVPGATAGSVGVNVAGTGKSNTVGRAMRALASGKCVPVELCID